MSCDCGAAGAYPRKNAVDNEARPASTASRPIRTDRLFYLPVAKGRCVSKYALQF
jgi:hypothetical protein